MKDIEKARFGEEDVLYRKGIAEELIKLFTGENHFSPIVLDGVWGSGKSVFCHQLKNLILEERKDLKVVYINAFQFDYTDDPFLMILGNILEILKNSSKNNKTRRKLLSKASQVIKHLPRIAIKQASKVAIDWIENPLIQYLTGINLTKIDLKEVAKEISDAWHKEDVTTIDEILKSFGQMSKQISKFKDVLQQSISNTNMVVIIDELDRCRPSFAIEILERVKHIFDISNLHFLLSMNTQVLEAAIKKLYGDELNAEEYLRKFYKIKFQLPTIIKRNDIEENTAFSLLSKEIKQEKIIDYWNKISNIHYLYKDKDSQKQEEITETQNAILLISQWLIEKYKITLRDVEHFIFNIQLYYTLKKFPNYFGRAILEFYALFIYTVDRALFNRFTYKKPQEEDYYEIVRATKRYAGRQQEYIAVLFVYVTYAVKEAHNIIGEYIFPSLYSQIRYNMDDNIRCNKEDIKNIFPKIEETLHFFSQS